LENKKSQGIRNTHKQETQPLAIHISMNRIKGFKNDL